MAVNKNRETALQTAAQREKTKKFPIGKLRENCRQLFGVSESTFSGAAYGMAGEYTVEEMRTHIDAWKKKGVK